jgi:hypothetical protein
MSIVARVHRLRDSELYRGLGVKELISPEHQASLEFLKLTLALSGLSNVEIARMIPLIDKDDLVEAEGKNRLLRFALPAPQVLRLFSSTRLITRY